MIAIVLLITLILYSISQADDRARKENATKNIIEIAKQRKDLAYWDVSSNCYRMFKDNRKAKRFIYDDANGFRYHLFIYDDLFGNNIAGMQYADWRKSINEIVIPKQEDKIWWINNNWC